MSKVVCNKAVLAKKFFEMKFFAYNTALQEKNQAQI